MANPIEQYWPSIYEGIKEFSAIADADNQEFQLIENAITSLIDNQFVDSSDLEAIKRRETMLNIKADIANESEEFRKRRILNRFQTKPPFTIQYLQKQLDFLLGEGLAKVSIDVQNFILRVSVQIPNAELFREMAYTIEQVKPANILYQQSTEMDDEIEITEVVSKMTLNRLSRLSTSWRLGTVPFATGQLEVVSGS